MFISKAREIAIPQWEHARQTAIFASIWGNADFDPPPLPRDAFLNGVLFHDRGYGFIDNEAINVAPFEVWLATQKRGIEQRIDDPIVDIMGLLHVKRLLSYDDKPERRQLMTVADERIAGRLPETEFSLDTFLWVDRILRWCDSLSYDFCFEEPCQTVQSVYPRVGSTDMVEVTHHIDENGVIRIDPWVFSVERCDAFITGYQLDRYPDHLEPVLLPFTLIPG